MSKISSGARLSFSNGLFMSYDPNSKQDNTTVPLGVAMNDKMPWQIFEVIPADNKGNVALKTSSGHYLTFNNKVGPSKDIINFGREDDPNLILLEHVSANKFALKTNTLGYVLAQNGGGLKPISKDWCFSTEATEIGDQQKFKFEIDKSKKRSKEDLPWDQSNIDFFATLAKVILEQPSSQVLVNSAKDGGFISNENAVFLQELRKTKIFDTINNTTEKNKSLFISKKTRKNDEVVRSISLNFGGGASYFIGLDVDQSITFDLEELREGEGKAYYSGSTSIALTLGWELGYNAGGSVSFNFFNAKQAGGFYGGVDLNAVYVAGFIFSVHATESGLSLTISLAGGANVGASLAGGYSIYEGDGIYTLPGGPQGDPPPRPTIRPKRFRRFNYEYQGETTFNINPNVSFPPDGYVWSWGDFLPYESQPAGSVPIYEFKLKSINGHIFFYHYKTEIQGFERSKWPSFYAFLSEVPGVTRPINLLTKRLPNNILLYWYSPHKSRAHSTDVPEGFVFQSVIFHLPL